MRCGATARLHGSKNIGFANATANAATGNGREIDVVLGGEPTDEGRDVGTGVRAGGIGVRGTSLGSTRFGAAGQVRPVRVPLVRAR